MATGRHARGKHRATKTTARHRRPAPAPSPAAQSTKLGTTGSPALIAGVAAVAVAAVGGLNISSGSAVAAAPTANKSGVSLQAAELDKQLLTVREAAKEEAVRASREAARKKVVEQQRLEAERAAAARRKAEQERLRKLFVLPLSDFRITSRFGEVSRLWSSFHTGLDLAAPSGTPVRAIAGGIVKEAGWAGSYGYRIVIEHADGTETWYGHLSKMSVRSGRVQAGQQIGRVGSSGNTTGPHLHLEVRVGDTPINPLTWLRKRGLDI